MDWFRANRWATNTAMQELSLAYFGLTPTSMTRYIRGLVAGGDLKHEKGYIYIANIETRREEGEVFPWEREEGDHV